MGVGLGGEWMRREGDGGLREGKGGKGGGGSVVRWCRRGGSVWRFIFW